MKNVAQCVIGLSMAVALTGNAKAAEAGSTGAAESLAWLEPYHVVWDSQSRHSGESMPVGGHDIGLNVWVENGDLLFYLGQSGCVDENGALLKHGRVRISLEPNPFAPGSPEFRQELDLRQSCVEITGQSDGAPRTTVRVWVEVQRPVVHVDIEAAAPVTAHATFETWRYQDIFLDQGKSKFAQAGMAMMNRDGFPGKVWLYRDTIEDTGNTRVAAVPSRSPCWDCPAVPCGVLGRAAGAAGLRTTSTASKSTGPPVFCTRPSSNSPT